MGRVQYISNKLFHLYSIVLKKGMEALNLLILGNKRGLMKHTKVHIAITHMP